LEANLADLSLIPDEDWREAERRAAVIRPSRNLSDGHAI